MTNNTIANYIYRMVKEDRFRNQRYAILDACKNTKLAILWDILFETDLRDTEDLEQKIYDYGSQLEEQDYMGRDIFVCLVAFLNLVIK